jgi:hypothetical protein
MKEYTVEQITELTKKVNENREKLYDCMGWEKKPPLTKGDIRMVLETNDVQNNPL